MTDCRSLPTLFVGPMSLAVVDACIEMVADEDARLGLIPSRRQIDWKTGYVNGWTTPTFARYVRERAPSMVLERDHGGPGQGDVPDDGMDSFLCDAAHFDLIHVDPFKHHHDAMEAARATVEVIGRLAGESECRFEIGTEEALFPLDPSEAEAFFAAVRDGIGDLFDRVDFLVVQFGTRIVGTRNTGSYDRQKAVAMLEVCRRFGKSSKEHNGDYLAPESIRERRDLGLHALNIAPEMGGIETECILEAVADDPAAIDEFFSCCIASGRWKKWFPAGFDPAANKLEVLRACGHYCFSMPQFVGFTRRFDYEDAIEMTKKRVKERIRQIL